MYYFRNIFKRPTPKFDVKSTNNIYKTLHRKAKTKQHERHEHPGMNSCGTSRVTVKRQHYEIADCATLPRFIPYTSPYNCIELLERIYESINTFDIFCNEMKKKNTQSYPKTVENRIIDNP